MRPLRLAAAVLVAGTVLTGCAGGSPGLLPDLLASGAGTNPPHDGMLSVGFDAASTHMSMTIDSTICGLADVPVDRVALDHPSPNIHLIRWGIDNSATTSHDGDTTGTLRELGSYVGRSVTRRCSDHFAWSTIAIELARDDHRATFDGIDVYYRAFGRPRELFVPYGVALCSATAAGTPAAHCLHQQQ